MFLFLRYKINFGLIVLMFINILLLHHHLPQEGMHTSCIMHNGRIKNGEISSLNELLMYGTRCLLMLTFPHCPGINNLLSKLIFFQFVQYDIL